jgi:hypothetical protein
MSKLKDYSDYTAILSTDLSTFGSEVTEDEHEEMTSVLERMIEDQFPNININFKLKSNVIGEDDEICAEIENWIDANWLKAT